MSFICDKCKKLQPQRIKVHRVVVETRAKTYDPRYKGNYQIDPGGIGYEIVREENYCKPCATRGKSKFIL